MGVSKEGLWGGRGAGMGRLAAVDQWGWGEGMRGEEKCKSSSIGVINCLLSCPDDLAQCPIGC